MIRRALILALLLASGESLAAQPALPDLQVRPAEHTAVADQQMVLSAATAGKRVVTVGDHGVVLLSDDGGASWRQAKTVPVQTTLTAVCFIDALTGWAAGQSGVILKTADGGETWTLQRVDMAVDRPLFSIGFTDANNGLAVGLWSLMLRTTDGGATWTAVVPPMPPGGKKADLNLFWVFPDRQGHLFVTAEGGKLLRSDDGGASWRYIVTGYRGTFWTGLALADGTLLVGGLRGTIYRSTDGGETWAPATSDAQDSVTAFAQLADGTVMASALDGVLLTSKDNGASFTSAQRDDREVLTAVLPAGDGKYLLFSKHGPQK